MSPKFAPKFNTNYGGSRFWYGVSFAGAALVLAVGTYLASGRALLGWEHSWFLKINGWPDGWRAGFVVVTAMGSSWMAAAGVAVVFLAKMYWLAWRLAVSVLAGYGVAFMLKIWVDRPRPEGLVSEANVRVAETFSGFPSAHSMIAVILTLSLLPYLPRVWRWLVVVPIIVLVPLSRLYLGVHVPLDVIGGAALGAAVVCGIRVMPRAVRGKLRLG